MRRSWCNCLILLCMFVSALSLHVVFANEGPKQNTVLTKGRSTFTEPITGMEFVFVPGGCYQMGDTFGDGCKDEKPVHEVCVNGFFIGKYEVTQSEYQALAGKNQSRFAKGGRFPVENVSWNEAQTFITLLNSKGSMIFRLPTEAEWEYAARSGGKKEKYAGGNSPDSVAWYDANSGGKTHQVGTKAANGLGIHDMSGNVQEMCQDWYGENYYSSSPRSDPKGPPSGFIRIIRGGSWTYFPWCVRTTLRYGDSHHECADYVIGFRLVLPIQQP